MPPQVFSWSYLHNQLVKIYGENNIRLKNILDLIQKQGVPLSSTFKNTPCSHKSLPDSLVNKRADELGHWTYEPSFNARKAYTGRENSEELFQKQAICSTIVKLDLQIPVIIGLLVTEDFRNLTPTHCLWQPPTSLTEAKGHALVVTGYDDVAQTFELLNSFGSEWGCNGVAYISYDNFARVVEEGYILTFKFEFGKEICPPKSTIKKN